MARELRLHASTLCIILEVPCVVGEPGKLYLPMVEVLPVMPQLRQAVPVGVHRHEHRLHHPGAKFPL